MSTGMIFVLWKGLLGFGLPIAVGLWELRQLRKHRDEDAAAALPRWVVAPADRAAAPAVADRPKAKILEPA